MNNPRIIITETDASQLEPAAVYACLTDDTGAEITLSRETYTRNADKDEAIRTALHMADIELAGLMRGGVMLPDGVTWSRNRINSHYLPE